MKIIGNKLIPDDGKWLYNGEICTDLVFLGRNAYPSEWIEVDGYIEIEKEEDIPDSEALAIITGGAANETL